MTERVNSFAALDDFAPKPRSTKPVEPAAIERVAAENNFPSRKPPAGEPPAAARPASPERRVPRRHVTGRNQQLNVKATAETIARFYRLSDERGMVLGELLEHALDALERSGAPKR